jgi:arsenate reductase
VIVLDITSAGGDPTPVDPEAVDAMGEIGIDISDHISKDVGKLLGRRFSYVISLCDRQKEPRCPIFPGAIWRQVWPMEKTASAQTQEERRALVRRLRDQIQQKVFEFANQH